MVKKMGTHGHKAARFIPGILARSGMSGCVDSSIHIEFACACCSELGAGHWRGGRSGRGFGRSRDPGEPVHGIDHPFLQPL